MRFNEDSFKRIQPVGSQGRAMTKMSLVTKMKEVRKENAMAGQINMIKVFTNHNNKNTIIPQILSVLSKAISDELKSISYTHAFFSLDMWITFLVLHSAGSLCRILLVSGIKLSGTFCSNFFFRGIYNNYES